MIGRVRIGTSGWVYPHWRGSLYPKEPHEASWLTESALDALRAEGDVS